MKFILGMPAIQSGSMLLCQEAKGIPVLEEIFSLPGITSILLTPEFITITKDESASWPLLESIVLSTLHHYLHDFPLAMDDQKQFNSHAVSKTFPTPELETLYADIEAIVDEYIRPSIEADGGVIHIIDFEKGVLYVQLQGACTHCPHSQETLKGGIENTLKYYIPEIESVQLI